MQNNAFEREKEEQRRTTLRDIFDSRDRYVLGYSTDAQ